MARGGDDTAFKSFAYSSRVPCTAEVLGPSRLRRFYYWGRIAGELTRIDLAAPVAPPRRHHTANKGNDDPRDRSVATPKEKPKATHSYTV